MRSLPTTIGRSAALVAVRNGTGTPTCVSGCPSLRSWTTPADARRAFLAEGPELTTTAILDWAYVRRRDAPLPPGLYWSLHRALQQIGADPLHEAGKNFGGDSIQQDAVRLGPCPSSSDISGTFPDSRPHGVRSSDPPEEPSGFSSIPPGPVDYLSWVSPTQ
jgi:hypothetical protein